MESAPENAAFRKTMTSSFYDRSDCICRCPHAAFFKKKFSWDTLTGSQNEKKTAFSNKNEYVWTGKIDSQTIRKEGEIFEKGFLGVF